MEESLSILFMTILLSSENLTAYHSSLVGFEYLKRFYVSLKRPSTTLFRKNVRLRCPNGGFQVDLTLKDRKSLNPSEILFDFRTCAKFLKTPS